MSLNGYGNISFLDDNGKRADQLNSNAKKDSMKIDVLDKSHKDEDYDPYLHRKVDHPISNTDTIIHLLKSSFGTGILAMPKAFYHAGFFMGSISTVVIGSIALYCIQMILKVHYELCKRNKVPSMDYPTIFKNSLLEGPEWMHRFAPYMVHVANFFILVYQLGICCAYIVFIGENMKSIFDDAFETETNVRLYMLAMLLPIILINWIRNLKLLAPFSTIANVITVLSFIIICYFVFREPVSLENRRVVGPLGEFPFFFGVVLFSMEAIGVIMPLENEMRTPKSFVGVTGVLNRAFVIIVTMYIGVGLFGYLKYGDSIEDTITLNLSTNTKMDRILANAVKGMLTFGIFITHGVACYVAIDLVWNKYVACRITSDRYKLLWEYVVRTIIVLITFLLAVSIPKLELFISLFGALCLSSLGLMFPALMETCVFLKEKTGSARTIMIVKNVLIGIFGLVGFFVGTSTSLVEIINFFTKEQSHQ